MDFNDATISIMDANNDFFRTYINADPSPHLFDQLKQYYFLHIQPTSIGQTGMVTDHFSWFFLDKFTQYIYSSVVVEAAAVPIDRCLEQKIEMLVRRHRRTFEWLLAIYTESSMKWKKKIFLTLLDWQMKAQFNVIDRIVNVLINTLLQLNILCFSEVRDLIEHYLLAQYDRVHRLLMTNDWLKTQIY